MESMCEISEESWLCVGGVVVASGWPRLSHFSHTLGTLAAPRSSTNICCVFATEQWDTWKGISETFPCLLQHTYTWGPRNSSEQDPAYEDAQSWSFIY